jgi:hypothetical protein
MLQTPEQQPRRSRSRCRYRTTAATPQDDLQWPLYRRLRHMRRASASNSRAAEAEARCPACSRLWCLRLGERGTPRLIRRGARLSRRGPPSRRLLLGKSDRAVAGARSDRGVRVGGVRFMHERRGARGATVGGLAAPTDARNPASQTGCLRMLVPECSSDREGHGVRECRQVHVAVEHPPGSGSTLPAGPRVRP